MLNNINIYTLSIVFFRIGRDEVIVGMGMVETIRGEGLLNK